MSCKDNKSILVPAEGLGDMLVSRYSIVSAHILMGLLPSVIQGMLQSDQQMSKVE